MDQNKFACFSTVDSLLANILGCGISVWLFNCDSTVVLIWLALRGFPAVLKEGLGSGISYIAKRYSEANKKHMESYDDIKPKKYITYLDTINLYGWTMNISMVKYRWD